MDQNQNLLTVIIVLHNTNNENLIRCLDSLEKQTFKNFSLFIINNDSDNELLLENLKIIDSYKQKFNITYKSTDNYLNNDIVYFAFIDKYNTKYACVCNPNQIQHPQRLEIQYYNITTNKYNLLYNNLNLNGKNIYDDSSYFLNEDNVKYSNILSFDTLMFNTKYIVNKYKWVMHSFDYLYDNINALLLNFIIIYYEKYNNSTDNAFIFYDSLPLITSNEQNYTNINNLNEIQKIGINKLFNNQIFYNDDTKQLVNQSQLTCIIICDETFVYNNYELCKQLFNIRFMSNNINIIISIYNNKPLGLSNFYKLFNIKFFNSETFVDAFNNAINACNTENILVITKPVRFYNKFDEYINIKLNSSSYKNTIIQPEISDLESVYGYYYDYNHNYRSGQKFILFNEKLTEKYINNDNNDNNINIKIPILDDDLVFFTHKSTLIDLYSLYGLKYNVLSNVFLSMKSYLNNINIIIDKNIKCKVLNNYFEFIGMTIQKDEDEIEQIKNIEDHKYVYNLLVIIYLLAYDLFYIYINLIHNYYDNDNLSKIVQEITDDEQLKSIKEKLIFKNDINYFFYSMYNFNNDNDNDIN